MQLKLGNKLNNPLPYRIHAGTKERERRLFADKKEREKRSSVVEHAEQTIY